MGIRVLFDTNIIIYRDGFEELTPELATLFSLLTENCVPVFYHPLSIKEIEGCKKEELKSVQLSKIHAYPELDYTPCPYEDNDTAFLQIVNPSGKSESYHDKNDNRLLYAVYKNAVTLLITNDYGIYNKAKRLKCESSVYLIDGAIQYFKELFPKKQYASIPFGIYSRYMSSLNLNDPIFNSLKAEYQGFEKWFLQKSREGRKCYVSFMEEDAEKLGSILITKNENEPIPCTPPLPVRKRVKISTLKVANLGLKLGEQLISIAINDALANGIDELYLTHFPEEGVDYLIDLMEEYGFIDKGIYQNSYSSKEEHIYLKKVFPEKKLVCSSENVDAINKTYYPSYYDGGEVRKFIIPIKSEYHDRLFLASGNQQSRLSAYIGDIPVEGYAIKKAYLTHSGTKKINTGDVLLYYKTQSSLKPRSHGNVSCITTIGVVDEIYYDVEDVDEISRITRKRTVYSYHELEMMKKPLTIILFRQNLNVVKKLELSELIKQGILNGPPQSITEISHENYRHLINTGVIDGRFTIN